MSQLPSPTSWHLPTTGAVDPSQTPTATQVTESLMDVLDDIGGSLLVSTYQAGAILVFRRRAGRVDMGMLSAPAPMGMVVDDSLLVVGTKNQLVAYADHAALASGEVDGVLAPVWTHSTGPVSVHDLGASADELWFVNTQFSCLCTIDDRHSFVVRWRPDFITSLRADDRCHLNGVAMTPEGPAAVTAFAETDDAAGWRDVDRLTSGVVIDVASGEVMSRGWCMPHSPRVHDGRLWVCDSGHGSLDVLDRRTGERETVARFDGFTRGLSFAGHYAFVGLSRVRDSFFEGLPLADRELGAGVSVLDTRTGAVVAELRHEREIREVYDVVPVIGLRCPELVDSDDERLETSFIVDQ